MKNKRKNILIAILILAAMLVISLKADLQPLRAETDYKYYIIFITIMAIMSTIAGALKDNVRGAVWGAVWGTFMSAIVVSSWGLIMTILIGSTWTLACSLVWIVFIDSKHKMDKTLIVLITISFVLGALSIIIFIDRLLLAP